jgi:hypothetical protein
MCLCVVFECNVFVCVFVCNVCVCERVRVCECVRVCMCVCSSSYIVIHIYNGTVDEK